MSNVVYKVLNVFIGCWESVLEFCHGRLTIVALNAVTLGALTGAWAGALAAQGRSPMADALIIAIVGVVAIQAFIHEEVDHDNY